MFTYGNVAVKYDILPSEATPLTKATNTKNQASKRDKTRGVSSDPKLSMPPVMCNT
jgi:hypothetical protein